MKQSVILKVTSLLLFTCSVTFSDCYSQELKAIFCGKSERQSAITFEELRNCDWKISVTDTAYVISTLKLSLVPTDVERTYQEYEVVGNIIPEKYRNDVLASKRILLEYMKASNKEKNERMLPAMSIEVKKK
jgi:hypothetical protein